MIKKLIAGSLICGLVGYAILSTSATDVYAETIILSKVETIKNNFVEYVQKKVKTTISYHHEEESEDGNNKIIYYKDDKLVDYTSLDTNYLEYLSDAQKSNNIPIKINYAESNSNTYFEGFSTSFKTLFGAGNKFAKASGGIEFHYDYTNSYTHSKGTTVSMSIMPRISIDTYKELDDEKKQLYFLSDDKKFYELENALYSLKAVGKIQMFYIIKLKKANYYIEKQESNKEGSYTAHENKGKIWVLDLDNDDILCSNNNYYCRTKIKDDDVLYDYQVFKPTFSIVKEMEYDDEKNS